MNNLDEKLAGFAVEKLEERKEFTFYFLLNPCNPKPTPTPTPNPGGPGNV